MHTPIHGRWRHAVTVVAAATLALVTIGAAPASAEAAPDLDVAKLDRHTAVGSDGSIATPPKNISSVTSSAPSKGTGGPVSATGAKTGATPPATRGVTAGTGIETIIGADERFEVNPAPYQNSATVLLTFDQGRCTGFMISPRTVATAGHCVNSGGIGGAAGAWHTNVVAWPGYNAGYGACAATTLFSVAGWVFFSDQHYDYGAVQLNCSIGNVTGWYGFFWTGGSLLGVPSITQGYPGDKPFTQWAHAPDFVRAENAQKLFYLHDTVGGQSGSPVYPYPGYGPCFPCAMAIHAYGLQPGLPVPYSNHNSGTRINQEVFNNLVSWL